jgi:two-component system sensor histidine kinase HydH
MKKTERPVPAFKQRQATGLPHKSIAGISLALLGWLLLSALNVFATWALQDRSRLIRDNDNERIINTLFTEMRNYSDLGSAVESNPVLSERIIGAAIYDSNLQAAYQWGKAPPVFEEGIIEGLSANRFGRYTIPDRQGRSAKFVLRFERMGSLGGVPGQQRFAGRPRQRMTQQEMSRQGTHRQERRQNEGRVEDTRAGGEQGPFFFSGLSRGRYFYTDISHPAYWRTRTLTTVFFPLVEILLLFLVFYISRLYLQSREYREKIEAQQNLVVLGTAAGTLAHEIKNPLLSIRLQTGILEKTVDAGKQEISIINQEVDRLSSLVYRVNDYLREPAGESAPIDICRLLSETSKRVCGSDVIDIAGSADSSVTILADENRMRSVLENILRNACESGSPVSAISASVKCHDGKANITIVDRGRGMANEELMRAFDPFYSTKSSGTGIGLAISKRFAEAAGGSIGIENREGGGLAVSLVFPLHELDAVSKGR